MLALFRSQHTNQSWLTTLTAIVDASALVIIGGEGALRRQAELTFAMGSYARRSGARLRDGACHAT
jgi:hypothetical protein